MLSIRCRLIIIILIYVRLILTLAKVCPLSCTITDAFSFLVLLLLLESLCYESCSFSVLFKYFFQNTIGHYPSSSHSMNSTLLLCNLTHQLLCYKLKSLELDNSTTLVLSNKENLIDVRRGSHWGGSPQNGLRDEWTCGTTLASAYVLCHLSTMWLQLQMKKRKSEWE